MKRLALIGCACLGLVPAARAQDPIEPETLTVELAISPGPNVFSVDQNWSGASRINVLSADDLSNKGNITPGLQVQAVLSGDGATLYTTSNYPERIVFGPTVTVLHEWDVATLSLKREIEIPAKSAMVETQLAMLSLVDDGKYVLVQNATPATSVTVVDLAAGAVLAEVPTPGCWGAIPVATGAAFLTLCGDGSMAVHRFAPDGAASAAFRLADAFDPDFDPLFTNPAQAGENLYFVSFNGNIVHVTFSDTAAEVAGAFPITEGIEDWAPGGSEVIAYHAGTGVAFVLMHSGAADGSHKDAAEEIWAVDIAGQSVLYRSVANHERSITVTHSSPPVVFAASDDTSTVYRYEVDPDARSAAKLAGIAPGMGTFVALVLTSE
jgi:methylamine dehydrogenase heavy chain